MAILLKVGLLGGSLADAEGEPSSLLSVHRLSEISVDGYLTVDQVSMSALQIFQAHLSTSLQIGIKLHPLNNPCYRNFRAVHLSHQQGEVLSMQHKLCQGWVISGKIEGPPQSGLGKGGSPGPVRSCE